MPCQCAHTIEFCGAGKFRASWPRAVHPKSVCLSLRLMSGGCPALAAAVVVVGFVVVVVGGAAVVVVVVVWWPWSEQ